VRCPAQGRHSGDRQLPLQRRREHRYHENWSARSDGRFAPTRGSSRSVGPEHRSGDGGAVSDARYEPVILGVMKTAISLTDTTFQRVESAAKRLGVSRSEFFARAAERWLNDLDDDQTTAAIDRAIAETSTDTAFTDAAATALAQSDRV
jgi:predicted DNA-binding protein